MAATPTTNRSTATRKRKKVAARPASVGDAASRLAQLAREAAALSQDLKDDSVPPEAAGGFTPSETAAVSAASQRRIALMAVMLHQETQRVAGAGDRPPAPSTPLPTSTLAFSWVPDLNVDNNSVSVGVPGVGEVSIGADGASASVDGVGGASIGPGGISANAGGASVSIGGNGTRVTVPGAGTVSVGTDGSVAVDPANGAAPGLPFPSLPNLGLCASELKIPIPVPKFVMEPFDVPIGVPRLQPEPLPISVPTPTLESKPMRISIPAVELTSKPISIPIPTFDVSPASPLLPGDLSSFDAVMDLVLAKSLERVLADMSALLKKIAKELKAADDAAGNPEQRQVEKIVQKAQRVEALLAPLRETYSTLRSQAATPQVIVTGPFQAAWASFQSVAESLLEQVNGLLTASRRMTETPGRPLDFVRQIYLIIGWVLSRYVRGSIKLSDNVTKWMIQIDQGLHAAA